MKLGEVTCSAQRETTHRLASNNEYYFKPGESLPVTDLQDFRYFRRKPSYDVEPTGRGQLYDALSGSEDSVEESISEFGYGVKQSIAKTLGIKANQTDEELTEELTEEAEKLKEEMERL